MVWYSTTMQHLSLIIDRQERINQFLIPRFDKLQFHPQGNVMSASRLGPILGATLVCNDINKVKDAYVGLGFTVTYKGKISLNLSQLWQAPALESAAMIILKAENDHAWLRLVEDKTAPINTPLKTHGWMSLETNVNNVDQIDKEIDKTVFKVIGKPAYLQVSDAIKAMQVIGPASEVTYLTQIDGPVPPFEVPMTTSRTGSLFVPVLNTPSRDASLRFYESMHPDSKGLKFDTKVTVLNNAWGLDIDNQFPVATLQLDGKCLFEIDEVTQSVANKSNKGSLPSGIAIISCFCKDIESIAKQHDAHIYTVDDAYYPATKAILLRGPANELIEIVELVEAQ